MDQSFYLDLARRGLRMPIGADLVLNEESDPEGVMLDGKALGRVVERAAERYKTPLAIPLMDLRLEKADLCEYLGVPDAKTEAYHFEAPPGEEAVAGLRSARTRPFRKRNQANIEAVSYIANKTKLVAVGMAIGPFSLMTKLVADPITAVAMSGAGVTGEEDRDVLLIEQALDLALATVLRSVRAQIEAGAQAVLVCEPAANIVYLSPKQLERNPGLFERWVLEPNRRVRALMREHHVDLLFHDCGELTTEMVCLFAGELKPSILSLGSSRKLWEDAAVVPKSIPLYGNLPTKTFYSDSAMPIERVRELTAELVRNMSVCGHPHILGSECDVLHVPGADESIKRKVEAMLTLEV